MFPTCLSQSLTWEKGSIAVHETMEERKEGGREKAEKPADLRNRSTFPSSLHPCTWHRAAHRPGSTL